MQGQRAASSAPGQPGKVSGAIWLWTSMSIGISDFQYSTLSIGTYAMPPFLRRELPDDQLERVLCRTKNAHDHRAADQRRDITAESRTTSTSSPTCRPTS